MRHKDDFSFVRFMTSRDGMPENVFAWAMLIIGVVCPAIVLIAG